jgi:acetyltransferase
MVCELPWMREMDINPLIVDESGAIAVDARIVISQLSPTAGRYDHMAIHPYPSNLVSHHQIKGGRQITLRPIRPEDAEIEHEFVKNLSPEAKYYRFMHTLRELSLAQLIRFTQIDYDREMAFVAVIEADGREEEIGVARYVTNPDGESCEFAIVVADIWKGEGVAGALMRALIESARSRGLRVMGSPILAENKRMLKFVAGLGFKVSTHPYDSSLKQAELDLV